MSSDARPLSAEAIVRRAAMMGLCSQTHHERLMRDAVKVRRATLDRERAAPAGLVEAARELLIVLDDTYPEDETHPTPLVAIAALRAALSEEG